MAKRKKTFSDSWHRVANQHAMLRPNIETHKQLFRGERWYVLSDPFRNEFFRVTEAAYRWIARLRPDRTIDQVWRECVERDPDGTPGQEEVIEILGQLNRANLIQSDLPPDSSRMFERYDKAQRTQARMQAMNFLFLKIPLFSPDRLLATAEPAFRIVLNYFGLFLWLLAVGYGVKIGAENYDELSRQGSGVLAPQNLGYLFVCTVMLKAIHEFGHGIMCKRFGGTVSTLGIMMVILTPLPYVDVTSSWAFPNKWQRILVGAAGMMAEFFCAAIAVVVWANTDDGLVHHLAYNVIFMASATTLLFNLNPLLKFDGYYIFSDLFDLPNLQQRANNQIKFLFDHYALGLEGSFSPARTLGDGVWLVLYGIAAAAYRIFLMLTIALFVAEQFFEIGLLIAAFCLVTQMIWPSIKFMRRIGFSNELQRVRARAWAVVTGIAAVLALLLAVIPFPETFSEPGVLWSRQRAMVAAGNDGFLDEVLVQSGTAVKKDAPLLRLRNGELDIEIRSAATSLRRAHMRFDAAQRSEIASILPLQAEIKVLTQRLAQLEDQRSRLLITAPVAGLWVAPEIDEARGQWFPRGAEIGRIVSPDDFVFIAIVSQQQASDLFDSVQHAAEIKFWGQAERTFQARIDRIIPAEQVRLPTPALGWAGGGEVEVKQAEGDGRLVAEPYFEVHAKLDAAGGAVILDEQSGKILFHVGYRPLIQQWALDLQQLLQKRLKL
jgi:putative peptide zinc metalloprotease protein